MKSTEQLKTKSMQNKGNLGKSMQAQDLKTQLMEEFDDIGFGNQARIVGVKRIELKYFLSSALSQMEDAAVIEKKGELKRIAYQMGYQEGEKAAREEVVRDMKKYNDTLYKGDGWMFTNAFLDIFLASLAKKEVKL